MSQGSSCFINSLPAQSKIIMLRSHALLSVVFESYHNSQHDGSVVVFRLCSFSTEMCCEHIKHNGFPFTTVKRWEVVHFSWRTRDSTHTPFFLNIHTFQNHPKLQTGPPGGAYPARGPYVKHSWSTTRVVKLWKRAGLKCQDEAMTLKVYVCVCVSTKFAHVTCIRLEVMCLFIVGHSHCNAPFLPVGSNS